MGKIEERGRKRARKRNFKKIILRAVALAGVLSVALVAPNVLGAMRKLGIPLGPNDAPAITRARRRLVLNGFLAYDGKILKVTPKGQKALRWLEVNDYGHHKPIRWDGRWRVLVFDIPEGMRQTRQRLRTLLRGIGFACLQHSVWIYPYDCEDVITLLKADLGVGKRMLYMIVDELEYDAPIKKIFKLV